MISYMFNIIPIISNGDGLYFMKCKIYNITNMNTQYEKTKSNLVITIFFQDILFCLGYSFDNIILFVKLCRDMYIVFQMIQ